MNPTKDKGSTCYDVLMRTGAEEQRVPNIKSFTLNIGNYS